MRFRNVLLIMFLLSILFVAGCKKEAVGRTLSRATTTTLTESLKLNLVEPNTNNWYRDYNTQKHILKISTNLVSQCKGEIRADKKSLSRNWNNMVPFATSDSKIHNLLSDLPTLFFGKKAYVNIICKSGKVQFSKDFEFNVYSNAR